MIDTFVCPVCGETSHTLSWLYMVHMMGAQGGHLIPRDLWGPWLAEQKRRTSAVMDGSYSK